MKMICVYTDDSLFDRVSGVKLNQLITIGKVYDVISVSHIEASGDEDYLKYFVKHDMGQQDWLYKKYFKSLDRYREDKLSQIGI